MQSLQFGSYEIRELLGEGGMGRVYRARDVRLGRDVALKVLPPHVADDPERLARLMREARVLAALNHPYVSAIYGLEESTSDAGSTQRGLVLELVSGDTLAERLAGGRLPVDAALRIATPIAHALEAAHERGIVHGDLKPANVKITPDGTVKVLDFGLARSDSRVAMTAAHGISTITLDGTVPFMGTVAYMSPEQARGLSVNRRADIWAFGAVLFEMLSGVRAFAGESVAETLANVLTKEPDWAALPADTPQRIKLLLERCLRKDPWQRLADATSIRLELEEADIAPVSGTRAGRQSAVTRERLVWSMTVVAVALAAAVVARNVGRAVDAGSPVRFDIAAPEPYRLMQMQRGNVSPGPLAVSPDGRQIALVVTNPAGQSLLAIRTLAATEWRAVSGTEGAMSPFWSPDGRSLGFFADGKLKRVAVSGGTPAVLCDAPSGRGASWGSGDSIVFASAADAALLAVPAMGGMPVPVTTVGPGEIAHLRPQFLPDGQRFLYRSVQGVGGGSIYVGALGSRDRTWLLDADSTNVAYSRGHLLFLKGTTLMARAFDARTLAFDGAEFPVAEPVQTIAELSTNMYGAFSASPSGVLVYQSGHGLPLSRLEWFDRSGRPLGIVGEPGTYGDLELSPDGRRALVFVQDPASQGRSDIWVYDVERGVRTRVTNDPAVDVAAIWSPDGGRIVFGSNRNHGITDIYEARPGGDRVLLADAGQKYPRSWSGDGRFLLYNRYDARAGENGLWLLPMVGERRSRPFLQKSNENFGQFSPNGRWVAYFSDESGRLEVYVAPFPGPGEHSRISAAGGLLPRWRRDGREIFYLTLDSTLMAVSVEGAGPSFKIGPATRLFDAGARPIAGFPYDVSADGRRFLINRLVDVPPPMATVVLDWTHQLSESP